MPDGTRDGGHNSGEYSTSGPRPHEDSTTRGPTQSWFGLRKNAYLQPRAANPYDYEEKYDEDPYGEELGANARFWRVLLDEAQVYDREMIEGWRDTLDVLLVFAGLFSSVVTSLVAQSSTALQPDYAMIMASYMNEMISLQRAWLEGLPTGTVPRSPLTLDTVVATALDRWCNALWYTSLALSLSVALVAVLVKQWIQAYNSNVSGTPQLQAHTRQFRLIGVERWNVPLIVGLLPMLLHLSLLLFFIGLSLYLFSFDSAVAYVVVMITLAVYTLYFAASILPIIHCQCPYRTPISQYGYVAVGSFLAHTNRWFDSMSQSMAPDALPRSLSTPTWSAVCRMRIRSLLQALTRYLTPPATATPRAREQTAVSRQSERLTVQCLAWVHDTSSNPTATSITVQAISGLPADSRNASTSWKDTIPEIFTRLDALATRHTNDEHASGSCERLARSLLVCLDDCPDIDREDFQGRLDKAVTDLDSSIVGRPSTAALHGVIMALASKMIIPPRLKLLNNGLETFPFINSTSPATPQLRNIVWENMIVYLTREIDFHNPWSAAHHLAIFLWRRAELTRVEDSDPELPELSRRAIHVLLRGPTRWDTIYSQSYKTRMEHLLQRALDSLVAEICLLSGLGPRHRQLLADKLFDEEVEFLGTQIKTRIHDDMDWQLFDTVSKLARVSRPLLIGTRAVKRLCFRYFERRIPEPLVQSVLQSLLDFLPGPPSDTTPRSDDPSFMADSALRAECLLHMSRVFTDHPDLALGVMPTSNMLVAIRRHVQHHLESLAKPAPRTFLVVTGTKDVPLHVVNNLEIFVIRYLQAVARAFQYPNMLGLAKKQVAYIVSSNEASNGVSAPSLLVYFMAMDVLISEKLPNPSYISPIKSLHETLLELARLLKLAHAESQWHPALDDVVSHPSLPQTVRKIVDSPVGSDAYRDLRQAIVQPKRSLVSVQVGDAQEWLRPEASKERGAETSEMGVSSSQELDWEESEESGGETAYTDAVSSQDNQLSSEGSERNEESERF